MPVPLTYPGVYVEEISSGVRTITGVATSITAFIGRAKRGPCDEPVTINSFGDFERIFGGLWVDSSLGYAVRDFYLNGGSQAVIVRLYNPKFLHHDAAHTIARAATGGVNGKEAKEKAQKYYEEQYSEEEASSTFVRKKTAAAIVLQQIKTLKDDDKPEEIKNKAELGVMEAIKNNSDPCPYSKSRLKLKIKIKEIEESEPREIFEAASEGKWGAAALRVVVDGNVSEEIAKNMKLEKVDLFNLTVRDVTTGAIERHLNLSLKESARRVDRILKNESKLIQWRYDKTNEVSLPSDDKTLSLPGTDDEIKRKRDDLEIAINNFKKSATKEDVFAAQKALVNVETKGDTITITEEVLKYAKESKITEDIATKYVDDARKDIDNSVSDGDGLTQDDFKPNQAEAQKKGLYALEKLFAKGGLFNLLCIPPYRDDDQDGREDAVDSNLIESATKYCEDRRAMLIVDPPSNWARDGMLDFDNVRIDERSKNAAIFFPRLKQPNPLRDNQIEEFAPCGAIAGIMARTDTQRGVWKAPAGIDATLKGVSELSVKLTDAENGQLNPLGINCLRSFPNVGKVVWGSRTLAGYDQNPSDWKYIPVRRLALFIEESLFRGTQWVVFEPNDEPLWAQIRLNVGSFMHNLFRQGAFQGTTPKQAYFVKCDKETTPQNDIDQGIVNIMVGFAPLKPAEFVVIKLQQIAGNLEV